MVYVLEPMIYSPGHGYQAAVRRIEASPSFALRFGIQNDESISGEHPLGKLLPIGRKMTRPTTFVVTDRNGEKQEVIGEAFNTGFNVLILIYAVNELPSSAANNLII